MSGLLLPKNVYAAKKAAQIRANSEAAKVGNATEDAFPQRGATMHIYDMATPVPRGVPAPHRFLMALMPVDIKAKIGSIFIPDGAIEAQMWINGLGKVCALGPGVYKGRRYEEMGLSPEDAPKIGDIVIYNAKSPNRITVDGRTLIYVADDATTASVDPALAHLIKF